MTLLVNFFGGPCSGKSGVAAGVFSDLKGKHINCELIFEDVKRRFWDGTLPSTTQVDIFNTQYKLLKNVVGKVDVLLTDGPLLNSLVYSDDAELADLAVKAHCEFRNLNIFLERGDTYQQVGRNQDKEGALKLDGKAIDVLRLHGPAFHFGLAYETPREISWLIQQEISVMAYSLPANDR